MAFNKIIGCDKSDMALWASSTPSENFVREIKAMQEAALRKLLKCNADKHDEYTQEYKAFEKILALIEECRTMR